MTLRQDCDRIARTNTGLASYCLDNDLPVVATFCLICQPEHIPLLDTSGVAVRLDGLTADDLRDMELMAPDWFRTMCREFALRETEARQAAKFSIHHLDPCSRVGLAALLPIGRPIMPLDFLPTDDQYYLPMYFDLARAARAATPKLPYQPNERDCDNFARAQWGWFAQAYPGNLAVGYAAITFDAGAHAVLLAVTADRGLVIIENDGSVWPVDVQGRRYGNNTGVTIQALVM